MFEIVRPAPHKRVDAIGYFCNGEVSQFWEVQGANKGTHSFERPTYAHGQGVFDRNLRNNAILTSSWEGVLNCFY